MKEYFCIRTYFVWAWLSTAMAGLDVQAEKHSAGKNVGAFPKTPGTMGRSFDSIRSITEIPSD
jgi:hypothetical protein